MGERRQRQSEGVIRRLTLRKAGGHDEGGGREGRSNQRVPVMGVRQIVRSRFVTETLAVGSRQEPRYPSSTIGSRVALLDTHKHDPPSPNKKLDGT